MNVLFATGEARPFAVSGSLAEFAGALPKALCAGGCDCRVILPLYADIPQYLRDMMHFITDFGVDLAGKKQYCGLFSADYSGVTFYFVDNEYYYRRSGIYGHYDDGERFAFFSRAVLEAIPCMEDFSPDVIHCNDWATGLIPVYLTAFYHHDRRYSKIRTVYTIHNIQYQGSFELFAAGEVAGLPENKRTLVEYNGRCNFMKAGIDQSDAVSTISPTYAKEILSPWNGFGLDKVLMERKYKLAGIMNGIDTESYDPMNDPNIEKTYSEEDLSGKVADKMALQKEIGLEQRPDVFLVSVVCRLIDRKGVDLITAIGERLLDNMDLQLVILGRGENKYEDYFHRLQEKYPGRVCAVTSYLPPLARRIYAGADVLLMPSKSEPCGIAQMNALRYGTVPVARETGGLRDSVHDLSEPGGNGFTFREYDAEALYMTLERAYEVFQTPEEWQKLVSRAIRYDFSWHQTAAAYQQLYRAVLR